MKNFPITNRKIKIGLIGAGRISKNHLNAINDHSDNLELVGICDTDENALRQKSEEYNVPGFTSIEKMLEETGCDVVTICTPSGYHPEHTKVCAQKGVHVITEKPMATNFEDGLSMVEACEKEDVMLFVVKQNRFNPTLAALKKAIDDGRFGKIYTIDANVFWTRPQDYYDQAAWRGTKKLDGGAFMNQASHYIDLVQWLVGPVVKVHSFMGTLARDIEAEDTGVINIKCESGAMGAINVTMLTYPKNLEGSITVLGEKGTVRIGGVAVNEIQKWEFEKSSPTDAAILSQNYETTSVYGFGHPIYYENVINTLRGVEKAAISGRDGLKSLELIVGAYISAKEERVVQLPLKG